MSRKLVLIVFTLLFTFAATPQNLWPDTKTAEAAHKWVDAYNGGEQAMMKFILQNYTRESLEKTSVEERIVKYRDMKEKFGTLTLTSITRSMSGELEVVLGGADGEEHPFIFNAQTEPPYRLTTVKVRMKHHIPFH
jgi:hypothetical protein